MQIQSDDTAYYFELMGLWTNLEVTTTIFCSCLPCIPRFIKHVRTAFGLTRPSSSDKRHDPRMVLQHPENEMRLQISDVTDVNESFYAESCVEERQNVQGEYFG